MELTYSCACGAGLELSGDDDQFFEIFREFLEKHRDCRAPQSVKVYPVCVDDQPCRRGTGNHPWEPPYIIS